MADHTENEDTACEIPQEFMESLYFSDPIEQIATIKAIISALPEVDQAKVQQIKAELAAGNYQINSEKIAAKLTEYSLKVAKEPELA